MGTTAAAGLRETADLIRSLAKQAGKKTYTLLVGKPAPAKLANFPEIEIFVLIADAQVPAHHPLPQLPSSTGRLVQDCHC